MARCQVCGTGPQFGRHIRHTASGRWERKAPRKAKMWSANVQRKRLMLNGKYKRVSVCTRCMRSLNQAG
ncbi:MAG: 50S ribosomal protein L28 [Chloroflexi bacterium]|nr:50S ribosomal protein L28 [Chloroflexota bacterium]